VLDSCKQSSAGVCVCVRDEEAPQTTKRKNLSGNYGSLSRRWLTHYFLLVFFSDGSLSRRWPMLCFS